MVFGLFWMVFGSIWMVLDGLGSFLMALIHFLHIFSGIGKKSTCLERTIKICFHILCEILTMKENNCKKKLCKNTPKSFTTLYAVI